MSNSSTAAADAPAKSDHQPSEYAIRTNPPAIMSAREAAIYLGTSYRSLCDLVAARRIKFARVGDRRLILRREWLDDFVAASAVATD